MSKKELTIAAFKELEQKHRNPAEGVFFDEWHCPLCLIHIPRSTEENPLLCAGCPLANKNGGPDCIKFASSNKLYILLRQKGLISKTITDDMLTPELTEAFARVADALLRAIPVLEEIEESRFTRAGWKYFEELNREW